MRSSLLQGHDGVLPEELIWGISLSFYHERMFCGDSGEGADLHWGQARQLYREEMPVDDDLVNSRTHWGT